MTILAIDPGKTGALALVDEADASRVPMVVDMPYLGDIPDVVLLNEYLEGAKLIVIEQQIPMPDQSSVSTATTFRGYGALLGWATLAGVPLITPRPALWKQKLGVSKDKGSSMALAARLFPSAGLHGPRGGAKDGRAEALCLAEFGRRYHLGLIPRGKL